jgi:formyltetrahydrofolate deformylase
MGAQQWVDARTAAHRDGTLGETLRRIGGTCRTMSGMPQSDAGPVVAPSPSGRSDPVAVRRVLTLSCPDRVGIVAAVSAYLAELGGNMLDAQQFSDVDTATFFMRVVVEGPAEAFDVEVLRQSFARDVASRFAMDYTVADPAVPRRLMVLVSRLDHCLVDLFYRCRTGSVPASIVAVAGNHDVLRPLVESAGIPFHHVPVTAKTKEAAEQELREIAVAADAEAWVLARYMQILSPGLCAELRGKAINIHHSFLPSFRGARPYHQAYARGVKLIGATAHYVTADLDEGPIIEQEVARVTHSARPEELAAVGRDLECQALARAVRWHVQNRVILNGHKTVVFP